MMGQLYVWYLNQLDDYNATADRMLEQDTQRLNERVSISGASITTGNVLSITVVNDGGNTAHIISLWVIDETANPDTHTQSSVDVYVPRGGSGTVAGTATYGDVVKLRLVTEAGNTVEYRIAPASSVTNLRMTLDASPPTVIGEHDVGITLFVFNNNTVYNALYNLQINPTPPTDITYTYDGSGESVTLIPPSTTTISSLRSGETASFTWTYVISLSTPGKTFTFKGRYTGASTFVSDTAKVVTPFGVGQESALHNVLGGVQSVFESIQWITRSPSTQTSGFGTWSSSWQVNRNNYLVLRVNLTNSGTTDITLSSSTALYMQRLDTSGFVPFYIVKESGGTISTYDGSVVLQANNANTVRVHFAVSAVGGNPAQTSGGRQQFSSAGTYIAFVGLFGSKGSTPYAQIIPFQGILVV